MYVHALIILIMIVGMVSIYRQHREHADQPKALPQHILDGGIVAVLVIGSQGQDAPGQRIHDVAAGRLHDDVPGEIGGQRPTGHQDVPEFLQLLLARQLAEQQQIADFLEAEPAAPKAFHQLDAVIAAVPEPAFTGRLHPIYHSKGLNARYISQSGHHAISILVAQSSLYFILVEHLRLQMVGASA